MRKVLTFLFIAILIPAASSFAGDSTSLAPQSAPQKSDYYTQGGHIYTGAGDIYAGGGDIRQVRLIKTNRLYAKGSGNWINAYDHLSMNNRVIYNVRRMRVNDYNPSYYKDVASKWYVDKEGKGPVVGGYIDGSFFSSTGWGEVVCSPFWGGGCSCPSGTTRQQVGQWKTCTDPIICTTHYSYVCVK